MASALDWSHDFCLSCDRQIVEGAYCSQACRLADLEKPGSSEGLQFSAAAAAAAAANASASSSPVSGQGAAAGFHLPPAVNFASYKAPSSAAPQSPQSFPSSYYYYPQSTQPTSPTTQRGLTTSSSRSSLSSISSNQSAGLSLQAANELRGYVRSFDQVRDMKRRLTHA